MAITIPGWLDWLEWVAGTDFSKGNEDLQQQLGDDIEGIAGRIRDTVVPAVERAVDAVLVAYPDGDGKDQIKQELDKLVPQLQQLADSYDEMGRSAAEHATQIRSNKLNGIIALAWLAAELAYAAFFGPGAPAAQAGALAATQAIFRWLGARLLSLIESMVARMAISHTAKAIVTKVVYEIVQEAVVEVLQGTSQEIGVQGLNMAQGFQDHMKWGEIGQNAAISAIAGGVGGGAGHGIHNLVGRTSLGDNRWAGMAKGAMVGSGAGLAGAGGAYVATGAITGQWEFDPRMMTGGALSGMGPSMVYGWRGSSDYAGGPMPNTRPPATVGSMPGPDSTGAGDGSTAPGVTSGSGAANGGVSGSTAAAADASHGAGAASDTAAASANTVATPSDGVGAGDGDVAGGDTARHAAGDGSVNHAGDGWTNPGVATLPDTDSSSATVDGAGRGNDASVDSGWAVSTDETPSSATDGGSIASGGSAGDSSSGYSAVGESEGGHAEQPPVAAGDGTAVPAAESGNQTGVPHPDNSATDNPAHSTAATQPPVVHPTAAGPASSTTATGSHPSSAATSNSAPQSGIDASSSAQRSGSAAAQGSTSSARDRSQVQERPGDTKSSGQTDMGTTNDGGIRASGDTARAAAIDGSVPRASNDGLQAGPTGSAAQQQVSDSAATEQSGVGPRTEQHTSRTVSAEPNPADAAARAASADPADSAGESDANKPANSTSGDTRVADDVADVLPASIDAPTTAEIGHAKDALRQWGNEADATDLLHGDHRGPAVATSARAQARANIRWWRSLTETQQRAVVRVHPREIGNAPGLDPTTVDTANRLQIARELDALSARSDLDAAEQQQLDNLRRTVRALADAQQRASAIDPDTPVRVLAYDSTRFGGQGRAAVAFGDLTTANHISWHVPGRGSALANLEGGLGNALEQFGATRQRTRPGETVASVAWLGYDAPSNARQSFTISRAREGAAQLVQDIASVDAVGAIDADTRPTSKIVAHGYGVDVAEASGRRGGLSGLASDVALVTPHNESVLRVDRFSEGIRVFHGASADGLYSRIDAEYVDQQGTDKRLFGLNLISADGAGATEYRPPDTEPAVASDGDVPADRRNNCAPLSLAAAAHYSGNTDIAAPEAESVGPQGMHWRALQNAAGAELTPVLARSHRSPHEAIAERLRRSGGRATALVVDEQTAPADEYGVGAHAHVMYLDPATGAVMVDDPRIGRPFRFDPDNPPDTQATWSVLYGADGAPVSSLAAADSVHAGATSQGDPDAVSGRAQSGSSASTGRGFPSTHHDPAAANGRADSPSRPSRIGESAYISEHLIGPRLAKNGLLADVSATTADHRLVETACRALTDMSGGRADLDSLVADSDTPATSIEPAENRAHINARWWHELSVPQQRALAVVHPNIIGRADGIPVAVRDEANRLSLVREINGYRDLLAPRHEEPVSALRRLVSRASLDGQQRNHMRALTEIQQSLVYAEQLAASVHPDLASPQVRLLSYDGATPRGRAVVAFGDVDTAASVSWHVFGVRSDVGALSETLKLVRNAYETTARIDKEATVAAIAWLDYEAPTTYQRATGPVAERGGARLASAVAGLHATSEYLTEHGGTPTQHHHLFGLRFGATVVSEAAAGGRLADRVASLTLLGASGTGSVRNAAEFGANVRVYAGSSSRDQLGMRGEGIRAVSGPLFDTGSGVDPTAESFGAIRIAAEIPYEGATATKKTALSRVTLNAAGYEKPAFAADNPVRSQYYWFADEHTRRPTEALANMGRIASGHGDSVVLAPHRTVSTPSNMLQRSLGSSLVDPEAQRSVAFYDGTVDRAAIALPESADAAALARDALALRGPGVRPADLLHNGHADDLTRARDLATDNARWWDALSPEAAEPGELGPMQRALVDAHPFEVGNAEGIPARVRDIANRLQLDRELRELLTRRPGSRLLLPARASTISALELQQMRNLLATREALGRSSTVRPGIEQPPVHLLSFDSLAFGGEGRAVVALGDVDTAEHVAWQVPGITTTVEKLPKRLQMARDPYEAMAQAKPDAKIASIAWVGYDAPSGKTIMLETPSPAFAEVGGRLLARDVMSYHAARVARSTETDGAPHIHLFGHSYGSTTTGYGAAGGRLSRELATITLVGSPGAGPVQNASEFGIGAENVFVAKVSYDPVTGLGGLEFDRVGRFFNQGIGLNPAIAEFDAVRVASQFPPVGPFGKPFPAHGAYFDYINRDTGELPESLENFGLIATGRGDEVRPVLHRVVPENPRVWHRTFGWAPKDPEAQRKPGDGTRVYRPDGAAVAREPVDDRPATPRGARPEIHGHRGGRGLWSENTLSGFARTLDLGVDAIELDVGLTSDGVPVISHEQRIDAATARDTGPARSGDPQYPYVGRPIRELTFDQVRTLSTAVVNQKYSATQQPAPPGSLVPSLAEVAQLADGRGVTLAVEVKTDPSWSDADVRALVAATVHALSGYDVRYRILGFDWRVLDFAARLAPENVERVALVSSRTATRAWLGDDPDTTRLGRLRGLAAEVGGPPRSPIGDISVLARHAGATMLSPSRAMVTDELVQQAGNDDMPLVPYTVNDPDEMRALIDQGVAGIVTDFPDLLRVVLTERGFDVPESTQPAPMWPAEHAAAVSSSPVAVDDYSGGSPMVERAGSPMVERGGIPTVGQGPVAGHPPNPSDILSGGIPKTSRPDPEDQQGTHSSTDITDAESSAPEATEPADADTDGNDQRAEVLPQDSRVTEYEHELAERALGRRAPRAQADWLLHGDYSDSETVVSARDRASSNARWWDALRQAAATTPAARRPPMSELQAAVCRVHPEIIGNADGVPAVVRDYANRLALGRSLRVLRAGSTPMQIRQRHNVESTIASLVDAEQMAEQIAHRTGLAVPPVRLFAYDAAAFDSKGRAVVAFGEIDLAESVSWRVPGIKTTVQRLDWNLESVANLYAATATKVRGTEVATVAWIGYDTPTGRVGGMRGSKAAAGARLLARDIAGFNASRAQRIGTEMGRAPVHNHIFGYSYGATTAAYAGTRLTGEVATITFAGSAGAGPVANAAGFGPDIDIFAAAASTDHATWVGTNRSSRWSSLMGLGIDPSVEAFQATRVNAEFPASFTDHRAHHWQYFGHTDTEHSQPTEALENFSRISAGLGHTVGVEQHRPGDGDPNRLRRALFRAPKTDPAATAGIDTGARGYRRPEGPIAARTDFNDRSSDTADDVISSNDCAPRSLRTIVDLTGSDVVRVPEADSVRLSGMSDVQLEEAAGGRLENLGSRENVAERLTALGPGATVLVVEHYSGPADRHGVGAHAFVMSNEAGVVVVRDPNFGEPQTYRPGETASDVSSVSGIVFRATGELARPIAEYPADPDVYTGTGIGTSEAGNPKVLGRIDVQQLPARIADIDGPVRNSVTGLVTGIDAESRTTPMTTIDSAGRRGTTASLVLHAIEVRGPNHNQLEAALGEETMLRFVVNDSVVHCKVLYRIRDNGAVQTTIIYDRPNIDEPDFGIVRQLIDASLVQRFPGIEVEVREMYDYGTTTDFDERTLLAVERDDSHAEGPVFGGVELPTLILGEEGSILRGERQRLEAAAHAWEWLTEELSGWPAHRVDGIGHEIADLVTEKLSGADSVPVQLDVAGDPGARTVRITVADTVMEFAEFPPIPAWVADAVAHVRHLELSTPEGPAIAVDFRRFAQISRALASFGASGGPLDVVQDHIDHGLRHRANRNRSRLQAMQHNVEAEYVSVRFEDDRVELTIYPFRDQDLRDGMRRLGLTGRGDAPVALEVLVDAITDVRGERRALWAAESATRIEEGTDSFRRADGTAPVPSGTDDSQQDVALVDNGGDNQPSMQSDDGRAVRRAETESSPRAAHDADRPITQPDFWLSDTERAALGPIRHESVLNDLGELTRIDFADGTVRVARVEINSEEAEEYGIPESGLLVREVAMAELDRLLGAGMVPSSRLWRRPETIVSLTEFVPHNPGLSVREYSRRQIHMAAVMDYIIGNVDRNAGNWGTSPADSTDDIPHLLLLDHTDVLPEGPDSFTYEDWDNPEQRLGRVRSPFVVYALNESLDPAVLEKVAMLSPNELHGRLTALGVEPAAVDDAVRRLAEIKRAGRITGAEWASLGAQEGPERQEITVPADNAAELADVRRLTRTILVDWHTAAGPDVVLQALPTLIDIVQSRTGGTARVVVERAGDLGERVVRIELEGVQPETAGALALERARVAELLKYFPGRWGIDDDQVHIWLELREADEGHAMAPDATPIAVEPRSAGSLSSTLDSTNAASTAHEARVSDRGNVLETNGGDLVTAAGSDPAFWLSDTERAALGAIVDEAEIFGSENLARVEFADGSVRVVRSEEHEFAGIENIPASGVLVREAAMAELDRLLRAGLVPSTRLWRRPTGPVSLTDFIAHRPGLAVRDYPIRQAHMAAAMDYIVGNVDRHPGNWATLPIESDADGPHLLLIDHTNVLPEDSGSFTFVDDTSSDLRGGRRRSPFVVYALGQQLHPDVLERLATLEPNRLEQRLAAMGIEETAIAGAVDRLEEIQREGRITGAAWPDLGTAKVQSNLSMAIPADAPKMLQSVRRMVYSRLIDWRSAVAADSAQRMLPDLIAIMQARGDGAVELTVGISGVPGQRIFRIEVGGGLDTQAMAGLGSEHGSIAELFDGFPGTWGVGEHGIWIELREVDAGGGSSVDRTVAESAVGTEPVVASPARVVPMAPESASTLHAPTVLETNDPYASSEARYVVAELDDPTQYRPDLYENEPFNHLTVGWDGRFYGADGLPHTTGVFGAGFLIGARTGEIHSSTAAHIVLYHTLLSGDGPSAFGVWKIVDGRVQWVAPFASPFHKSRYGLLFTAQLRHELIRRGVDLSQVEFSDENLGALWRAGALFRSPGRAIDADGVDVGKDLDGAGDFFWTQVIEVTPREVGLAITFALNPVGGEPGAVTVDVWRTEPHGTVEARYQSLDLGPNPAMVEPILRELHVKLSNWLAADDGASWSNRIGIDPRLLEAPQTDPNAVREWPIPRRNALHEARIAERDDRPVLSQRGVYKPEAGEWHGALIIPPSGLAVREIVAYEISEMLDAGLVPLTEKWSGTRGPGSWQVFVPGTEPGRPVSEYSLWERDMMAVLDYLLGSVDRTENYLTSAGGRIVAIDHAYTLPVDRTSFTQRPENVPPETTSLQRYRIGSVFVADAMGRPLSPSVLQRVDALDPAEIDAMLSSRGIEREAIDGALARLAEIRTERQITGSAWLDPTRSQADRGLLLPAGTATPEVSYTETTDAGLPKRVPRVRSSEADHIPAGPDVDPFTPNHHSETEAFSDDEGYWSTDG